MNTCICCGAVIPEGRQVCPNCDRNTEQPDIVLKDGTPLYLKTPNYFQKETDEMYRRYKAAIGEYII